MSPGASRQCPPFSLTGAQCGVYRIVRWRSIQGSVPRFPAVPGPFVAVPGPFVAVPDLFVAVPVAVPGPFVAVPDLFVAVPVAVPGPFVAVPDLFVAVPGLFVAVPGPASRLYNDLSTPCLGKNTRATHSCNSKANVAFSRSIFWIRS